MGARTYDKTLYEQAGITPPKHACNYSTKETNSIKDGFRKQLRILDEQNAISRYRWYNLPEGLDSRLMERILYYKGQGMFFKLEDKFYFLPYALDGTIDCYGRFTGVTPLPFNGSTKDKDAKPLIQGLVYTPMYDIALPEDYIKADGTVDVEKLTEKIDRGCVLIKDYSEQISQTVLPRQQLQEPLLDIMAECVPFMRTNLVNSTGIQGLRVGDSSEYNNVIRANEMLLNAAYEAERFVPITAAIDFQTLSDNRGARPEEYMLALQSLDNYRLSLLGLRNGGLFQKKSHMLEAEQEMNSGNIGLVLADGLWNRQEACDIVNSVWGLGVSCQVSETIANLDTNGDMVLGSEYQTMIKEEVEE